MRRLFLSILIIFSLSGEGYALDIVGTGRNQGEALHRALQNLSEIVSGVEIKTHIRIDKRMTGDDYSVDVRDFFAADSEFFVSNIQRHIAELKR